MEDDEDPLDLVDDWFNVLIGEDRVWLRLRLMLRLRLRLRLRLICG